MKKNLCELISRNRVVVKILSAFLISVSLTFWLNMSRTQNYLLFLLIFVAVMFIVHYAENYYNRRRLKFSLWYSIPFGIMFWLGHRLSYGGMILEGVSWGDIPLTMLLIGLFTMMGICVFGFIDQRSFRPEKKLNRKNKWWVYAAVILLCYLPIFLVFFPGLVSNDSAVQIKQAIGEDAWSNWHPVLHTLFVAIPVNIGRAVFGDLTAGIALSTIMQMVILSMIYGYVVHWVINLTHKPWIGYVLLGFFALCPIVSGYAVTMWKDVLFSAVFLLLFVKIVDLILIKNRHETIRAIDLWSILLLTILAGLLRNGGVLVVMGIMIGLIIYYKQSWKTIILCFGGIVGLILMVQGPIFRAFNIAKSPMMESLSVPAQQIGYVVNNYELEVEDKDILSKYANIQCLSEKYETMNADPAKNCFNYHAVEDDKMGFLLLWGKMLPKYLKGYIWSYLLQMNAYWDTETESWVLELEHSHDPVWLKAEYVDMSLLGDGIKDTVTRFFGWFIHSIWFSYLGSVGILFWGVYFAVVVFLYMKQYHFLVPMSGLVVYMISLLVASPVSWIFRYVFSLLLIMPVLLILCFMNNNNDKVKKGKR